MTYLEALIYSLLVAAFYSLQVVWEIIVKDNKNDHK